MIKQVIIAFCTTLLLLIPHTALAAETGQSATRTIIVKPDRLRTAVIQDAVREARPGDTVLLKPGTYREHVVVDKSVILKGEGAPRIDGGGSGDVLTLLADHVTVTGLVITNGGYDQTKDESGIKIKSSHNVITGNQVLGNTWGIYVYSANDNVISRNIVRGRKEIGQSGRGNGIHLWKSQGNVLDGNVLSDNRDALYFSFADHNRISHNLAYGQRYGVHYMYSNYNVLEYNVLRNNKSGMAMMYSSHNEVKANQVYANDKDGIQFRDMEDNVVQGNIIYNNHQGLFMYNSNRNTVRDNLLAADMTGLNLAAGSDCNIFVNNSWVQNVMQVKLSDPLKNKWDDGQTGNYWSEYAGFDPDGDGIGNTAYWQSVLAEYLVARFPLVKLLFNSPLLQAVQVAEKAFPILHSAGVVDRYPLMQPPQGFKKLPINWQMKFTMSPSEDDAADHSEEMLLQGDDSNKNAAPEHGMDMPGEMDGHAQGRDAAPNHGMDMTTDDAHQHI